jgi:hypothetical protein
MYIDYISNEKIVLHYTPKFNKILLNLHLFSIILLLLLPIFKVFSESLNIILLKFVDYISTQPGEKELIKKLMVFNLFPDGMEKNKTVGKNTQVIINIQHDQQVDLDQITIHKKLEMNKLG